MATTRRVACFPNGGARLGESTVSKLCPRADRCDSRSSSFLMRRPGRTLTRSSGPRKSFGPPTGARWRCSPARCGAPRVPERRLAAWIVVLVHAAPRAVLGCTVERPDDDPAGWPEQPFGGAGRLGRGRVRCRCPARSHARIARVAADPPRAVLGGRELLRRRRLLSGVCACTAATFSAGESVPRSTRSTACAGWRSRACMGSANLALTPI